MAEGRQEPWENGRARAARGSPLHLGGGLWLLGRREASSPEESWERIKREKGPCGCITETSCGSGDE